MPPPLMGAVGEGGCPENQGFWAGEALFRRLAEPGGEYSPDALPALAAEYGAKVDFDATMPLVERHRFVFRRCS